MLARCNLGEVVPARLHLEESDERAHCSLTVASPTTAELRWSSSSDLAGSGRLKPSCSVTQSNGASRAAVLRRRCASSLTFSASSFTDIAWHGSGKRTRDTPAATGERLLAG